jgi:broad specificity phosphatase PhoE
MTARRALFLRHGESVHNAHSGSEELAEHVGDRLTELGQEQARAAGAGISALGIGVDRLLSSPKLRTRETAALLGERLGLEPELAEETYEVNVGESFEAGIDRVRRLRLELDSRPAEELTLLVTHGLFTRFFLFEAMLGERFEEAMVPQIWHLTSHNCALTTFASGISRYPDGGLVPGWTCLSWMERPWDRP